MTWNADLETTPPTDMQDYGPPSWTQAGTAFGGLLHYTRSHGPGELDSDKRAKNHESLPSARAVICKNKVRGFDTYTPPPLPEQMEPKRQTEHSGLIVQTFRGLKQKSLELNGESHGSTTWVVTVVRALRGRS